jgi:hypothetical protein
MTGENRTPSGARITVLKRVFKAGPLVLPCLNSALAPEASLKLYESSYPFLRHVTLAQPTVQGDSLVYEVEKRPVDTKG